MKHENPSFANGMFKFNCPHCKGEIEIDAEQLSQVNTHFAGKYPCPLEGCGQEIEFPTAEEAEALKGGGAPAAPAAVAPAPPAQANPAAAPTAPPAAAPAPPASGEAPAEIVMGFHGSKMASLEREAMSGHRICVKTFLHAECTKNKKDNFDETVSEFLSSIDEDNLMGVHPIQYTMKSTDQKWGMDFGVVVVYKTTPDTDEE